MLVKSNYDGRMVVPIIDPANSALISKGKGIVLDEGWNDVEEILWDFVYPVIKDKIESGVLELYCKEEENKETKEVRLIQQPIYDVRADRARGMVETCFSISTLERWVKNPKLTPELRNLVDMQLDACYTGVSKGNRVR